MKDDDAKDVMKEFFSRNIIQEESTKPIIDYGQGFAIGTFGTYELYTRSLSANGKHRLVYMGKDINFENLSMTDNTTEFVVGDVPKILIKFTNLASSMGIRALWQDDAENTILESYYGIPAPYTKRYDWWTTFLVAFKGPENLEEGYYKVILLADDEISDTSLNATIEFTVSEYQTEEQDSQTN